MHANKKFLILECDFFIFNFAWHCCAKNHYLCLFDFFSLSLFSK